MALRLINEAHGLIEYDRGKINMEFFRLRKCCIIYFNEYSHYFRERGKKSAFWFFICSPTLYKHVDLQCGSHGA
jgi:hypothetical protein